MTLDSALKNRRFPLFCCCGVCGVMNCHLQPVPELARVGHFAPPGHAGGMRRGNLRHTNLTPRRTQMRFRPAVVSELPQLACLALASKAHWGYSTQQLQIWRDDLTPRASWIGKRPFIVAENDAGVVGFYTLEANKDGTWALDNLWVCPTFIGQGFGRALFSHAMQAARNLGATVVTIDAEPYAEPFYVAQGARRNDVVRAPIEGMPERIRPQLEFCLVNRRG